MSLRCDLENFDCLEPRTLMDGATGVITDAYTTLSKLVVVVRYDSDQNVDASTLGDNDIRLTGPNQYNRFGTLVQRLPQTNGDVIGVYNFASPGPTWDFARDNGAYAATLQAGTVLDAGGDGNAQALLRTFSMWFGTPAVRVSQIELPHFGAGVMAAQSADLFDVDSIIARFSYSVREPLLRLPGPQIPVSVTGPNGWVGELLPRATIFDDGRPAFATGWSLGGVFGAPGGGWDYTDNGTYAIKITIGSEVVFSQDFVVNIGVPRAEIVSTATNANAMVLTMRYSAPSGIALNSIGDGDVALGLRQSLIITTPTVLNGALVGTPVRAANGSVTATYRFAMPNNTPWTAWALSSITVRAGQVLAGNGQATGGQLLRKEPLPLPPPAVTAAGTLALTRNAWDVEVVFSNPGGLIQANSIRGQNLIVQAPDGRATRVSVVSITPSYDGTLRVRYQIIPQIGVMRLFNGNYTLSLAANSISQGPLGYVPAQGLGTYNITF